VKKFNKMAKSEKFSNLITYTVGINKESDLVFIQKNILYLIKPNILKLYYFYRLKMNSLANILD
jgi:hypothetical protein